MSPELLATDLQWADLQVRTLCEHDAVGRMVRWNEPDAPDVAAPFFWFAATLHGNLWRFRQDLPDALVRELSRLAAAERTVKELGGDPERLASFQEHLVRHGLRFERRRAIAYRFPQEPMADATAERLEPEQLAQLQSAFPGGPEFGAERLPCHVVRRDEAIVSACYAATASVEAGAVELGVETVASHRGQGIARAVVGAWAREVTDRGQTPLYSTRRENRASRALASKLGLDVYAATIAFHDLAVA